MWRAKYEMRMRAIIMKLSLKLWLCVRFRNTYLVYISEEASFTLLPLTCLHLYHALLHLSHSPLLRTRVTQRFSSGWCLLELWFTRTGYGSTISHGEWPTRQEERITDITVCMWAQLLYFPVSFKIQQHKVRNTWKAQVTEVVLWLDLHGFFKARFQRELWEIPEDDWDAPLSSAWLPGCLPFQW